MRRLALALLDQQRAMAVVTGVGYDRTVPAIAVMMRRQAARYGRHDDGDDERQEPEDHS